MGGCLSTREKQPDRISQDIDQYLQDESIRIRKEPKILLLGTPGSGKSTILKQMHMAHLGGYSSAELLVFRPIVYKNLVDSAQDICNAIRKLDLDCVEPCNRPYIQLILSYQVKSDPDFILSPEIATAIESLVQDPIMGAIMDRSSEFHLMDSADYFFSQVKRISAPNYIPNGTDVLRVRAKTTGITETRFIQGQLSMCVFDVGGQRSERRKWIHCFEGVTSIIFCVAISEYDQVVSEGSVQNRLSEALTLFESVVNSRWFDRSSVILFLNKIDVFKRKLPKSPLSNYFPEYAGGPDINKAAKFILWKFTSLNRAHLPIYPHLTQETDTSNIRLVFSAVKETVLTNALKASGILRTTPEVQ